MDTSAIKNSVSSAYKYAKTGVKTGAKVAASTLSGIKNDKTVIKSVKSALPLAALCVGGFGLLGLLKNRKRDGKPGNLEQNCGNFAKFAFVAGAFSKFFNKPIEKEAKEGFEKIKSAFDASGILNKVKAQKNNVVAFALMVGAVGVATKIVAKITDPLTKPDMLEKS